MEVCRRLPICVLVIDPLQGRRLVPISDYVQHQRLVVPRRQCLRFLEEPVMVGEAAGVDLLSQSLLVGLQSCDPLVGFGKLGIQILDRILLALHLHEGVEIRGLIALGVLSGHG